MVNILKNSSQILVPLENFMTSIADRGIVYHSQQIDGEASKTGAIVTACFSVQPYR